MTPTVGLEVGNTPGFSGQGVAAMQNQQPGAQLQFGAALQKEGKQMTIIARQLQDQLDDAKSKQLYNEFANDLESVQLDYLSKSGPDAVMTVGKDPDTGKPISVYDQAMTDLEGKLGSYLEKADNDKQKYMLQTMSASSIRSASSTMARHSITEQRKYADAEARAHVNVLAKNAGIAYQDWADPTGQYATNTGAAIIAAHDYADTQGWAKADPNVKGSEDSWQRKELIQNTYDSIHTGALNSMIANENYFNAMAYLTTNLQNKTISQGTFNKFVSTVRTGYEKQAGTDIGKAIVNNTANTSSGTTGNPNSVEFKDQAQFLTSLPSGYLANDGQGGPVRFGLHMADGIPVIDMDNEDAMEQLQIMQNQSNYLGIQPEHRAMHLYLISKLGVAAADKIFADAGEGNRDPKVMENVVSLASEAITNKYGIKVDGVIQTKTQGDHLDLMHRDLEFIASKIDYTVLDSEPGSEPPLYRVDKNTGVPLLQDMLKHARDTIFDKDKLDHAETYIKAWHTEQTNFAETNYTQLHQSAQDIAFARIGGWQDIPPEQWNAIRPEDKAALREGPNRGDDPDTVIKIMKNPELMLPGNIEQFRPLLSESQYKSFLAAGIEAQNAGGKNFISASVDSNMLDSTLARFGFDQLSQGSDSEKLDYIQLNDAWKARVDMAQVNNGNNPISRDDKQAILNDLLMDKVMLSKTFADKEVIASTLDPDQLEDAYVNVGGEEIYLSSIPVDVRSLIVTAFNNANMRVSEKKIAEMWLRANKPKNAAEANQYIQSLGQ